MWYFLYGVITSTSTSNFFIVNIVASKYGFDTISDEMLIVIPFSVSGDAMNNADMNWLDMFPG